MEALDKTHALEMFRTMLANETIKINVFVDQENDAHGCQHAPVTMVIQINGGATIHLPTVTSVGD